jgi:hypothetical protein
LLFENVLALKNVHLQFFEQDGNGRMLDLVVLDGDGDVTIDPWSKLPYRA